MHPRKTRSSSPAPLELRPAVTQREDDALYLNGQRLRPGQVVEILWRNKFWQRGVFGIDRLTGSPVVLVYAWKKLRVLNVPSHALLRWPG